MARQRTINSARPRWQRGINGFNANPEEEQEPPDAEVFKDKSIPGQEPLVSPRGTPTIQPTGIQETNRRRAQNQGKYGQGTSVNRPPNEPQGAGAVKSSQEQERPISIRRTYPSQPKDAPETKRQTGAGKNIK